MVAGPDIGNLTVKAKWHYHPERRTKEYVASDGRVLDRQPMTGREVERMGKRSNGVVVGQRFHLLVVLGFERSNFVKVRCDCGTEKEVNKYNLLAGNTKTCGAPIHRRATSADDAEAAVIVAGRKLGVTAGKSGTPPVQSQPMPPPATIVPEITQNGRAQILRSTGESAICIARLAAQLPVEDLQELVEQLRRGEELARSVLLSRIQPEEIARDRRVIELVIEFRRGLEAL